MKYLGWSRAPRKALPGFSLWMHLMVRDETGKRPACRVGREMDAIVYSAVLADRHRKCWVCEWHEKEWKSKRDE